MNKSKRFSEYFICMYFNEINEKVGVFKRNTPAVVIKEAKEIFDEIEYE